MLTIFWAKLTNCANWYGSFTSNFIIWSSYSLCCQRAQLHLVLRFLAAGWSMDTLMWIIFIYLIELILGHFPWFLQCSNFNHQILTLIQNRIKFIQSKKKISKIYAIIILFDWCNQMTLNMVLHLKKIAQLIFRFAQFIKNS